MTPTNRFFRAAIGVAGLCVVPAAFAQAPQGVGSLPGAMEAGGKCPVTGKTYEPTGAADMSNPSLWPNQLDLSILHQNSLKSNPMGADFDYAAAVVRRHGLAGRVAAVLFSPVHGALPPAELARWILEDALPVRLHLQTHKYIWGAETRGV